MVAIVQSFISICLFVIPWTVGFQDPLSMRFPRQEYWNRLSFLSEGDLSDTGIEPTFPNWQADSLALSN